MYFLHDCSLIIYLNKIKTKSKVEIYYKVLGIINLMCKQFMPEPFHFWHNLSKYCKQISYNIKLFI